MRVERQARALTPSAAQEESKKCERVKGPMGTKSRATHRIYSSEKAVWVCVRGAVVRPALDIPGRERRPARRIAHHQLLVADGFGPIKKPLKDPL